MITGRNRDTAWYSIIDRGLAGAACRWSAGSPGNFAADGSQHQRLGGSPIRRRMSGRPAPSLALLSAVTALAHAFCGLHMVVPALPLLVAVFTDTPAHVQLVVSLYLAGIAAGQLVYGPVSDRFGRRPVLLAGLATFLVGTAMCGAAPWWRPALIAGHRSAGARRLRRHRVEPRDDPRRL